MLGVERDADTSTLTKAFRRAARRTHPDRGGKKEDFQEVAMAFDVLVNPERREHYDRTGEVRSEPIGDPIQAAAIGHLTQALGQVLQSILSQGGDPTKVDLLSHVQRRLKGSRQGPKNAEKENQKALKKMEEVLQRLTVEEGAENVLAASICTHIEGITRSIEAAQRVFQELDRAEAILARHQYRWEEPEKVSSNGMRIGQWVITST